METPVLPEPLTPDDCNLRGMPFMPLQVVTLLDSDLFALSTGDEFKAAVALWCKSWNQIPGGSLPNDERILAAFSQTKNWKKVKEMAMRGWILCADNRFYHPVVAENVLKAWESREEYQEKESAKDERQKRWREQCKALSHRLRELGVTPPKGAGLEVLRALLAETENTKTVDGDVDGDTSTVDAGKMPNKGEGHLTDTDTDTDKNQASATLTSVGARASPVELSIALRKHGINTQPADPRLIALSEQGTSVQTATAACREAKAAKPDETVGLGYIVAILKRWASDAASLNVQGAQRPSHTTSKQDSRAAAAASIGLGARHEPNLIIDAEQ